MTERLLPFQFDAALASGEAAMASMLGICALGEVASVAREDGRRAEKMMLELQKSNLLPEAPWVISLTVAVWHLIIQDRPFHIGEYYLHNRFQSEVATLINGAVLVDVATGVGPTPDFFVSVDGAPPCPVEIKKRAFDASAVKQLRRYMVHFKAVTGYAVAPELTCELPSDMLFVPLSFDRVEKPA